MKKCIVKLPETYADFEEAVYSMIENEWEGLVLYDISQKQTFTTNSKHKRQHFWKWKLPKEDDFFVIGLEPEKGNDSLVGALIIGQFDRRGNIINCGNCGSGLKKEEKPIAWDWVGRVFEIRFDYRITEPNEFGEYCLQFPRIIRPRPDKNKEECIFEMGDE